jgi:hypothetical protein
MTDTWSFDHAAPTGTYIYTYRWQQINYPWIAALDTRTHDLHHIPESISVTRHGYKAIPISVTRG